MLQYNMNPSLVVNTMRMLSNLIYPSSVSYPINNGVLPPSSRSVDNNWDAFDDFITRDDVEQKEPEKLNATRRPVTSTARKTMTAADDWLGLTTPQDGAEITSYEPSSSLPRGPNASRRQQNFRRQSTQQRASRSAGLLFSDDDDDGDGKNKKAAGRNVFDLFADPLSTVHHGRTVPATSAAVDGGGGDAADRLPTAAVATSAAADPATVLLKKRRETSPTITVTTAKTSSAVEKMPSWLSGLIQQKDETLPLVQSHPPIVSNTEETATAIHVKKSDENESKVTSDNNQSSILSLLRGKDSLQSSILELIQELTKKKQDIQNATYTLIHNQQNSDLLIKALLMDNSASTINQGEQELDRLRSENNKFQLTIDHISKKHELELDALKTRYELQQNVLHEKLERYEERIGELEVERKTDMAEWKENEKRLKETYEDRLRVIHESHLIDLKQSAEIQKIKMNHLEEVECSLRESKPKRLTSEEMTAREISISAQDKKLKDLQEEVDKQLSVLEGEKSALQMKIEEFQSRNQRERNELELENKELKRSTKAFEDSRRTWEREKKSEIQYIENRKQELEAVRSSVVEEQRKLSEERFEVASERYRLESMLKLDTGSGTDLIQAKVQVKENFKELEEKEKELAKRLEQVKELEKHLSEEKHKLQEIDDEIKLKSIRVEKMFKTAISKQEEGLKALESAKDIQNKFDKKGKDIHNRLLDIIRREENVVLEENKLAKEKDAFNRQRKKLDLVLPQLSVDEMRFLNPKLNKYEAEKEVYYNKTQLY